MFLFNGNQCRLAAREKEDVAREFGRKDIMESN
jgi:hypothetical protein